MSEYPLDYPLATPGSSLDLVFRTMHEHGYEFGEGEDWQCPVHTDEHPSLGIKAGEKKAVVVSCAQCIRRLDSSALFATHFAAALGLDRELLDTDPEGAPKSALLTEGERQKRGAPKRAKARVGEVTNTYVYDDESGYPILKVERLVDADGKKFFRQWSWDGNFWSLGVRESVVKPVYYLEQMSRLVDMSHTLPDDEKPILCWVEGEKSAEAISVGGGGNATCVAGGSNVTDAVLSRAIKMLDGIEHVTIIADNDQSGYAFALRSAREFKKLNSSPSVKVARSATDGKGDDIVEHFAAGGTFDSLVYLTPRQVTDLAGSQAPSDVVVPPRVSEAPQADPDKAEGSQKQWAAKDEPYRVARQFLKRNWTDDEGHRRICRWREAFYEWDEGVNRWVIQYHESLRSRMSEVLEVGFYVKVKEDEEKVLVPWKPNTKTVDEVVKCMGDRCLLDPTQEPGWFDRAGDQRRLMTFRNGSLVVGGDGVLIPPTPDLFNLTSLPFDYDPQAGEPLEWFRFLQTLWPDPAVFKDNVALLQEWFAYVLSGRVDLQKVMLFIGPPRAGKGTIVSVLESLLGPGAFCGPTLQQFSTDYGLSTMYDKALATVGDAEFDDKRLAATVVARIKSISGQDTLDVNRKYHPLWTGKIPARLMICCNQMPVLADNAGAVRSRFLSVKFDKSFLGREDEGLADRLHAELPAILNWALGGLERLDKQGQKFTRPAASAEVDQEIARATQPILAFLEDMGYEITGSDDDYVVSADIYSGNSGYTVWCDEQGDSRPMNKVKLGQQIVAAHPSVRSVQKKVAGRNTRVLVGIRHNAGSEIQ